MRQRITHPGRAMNGRRRFPSVLLGIAVLLALPAAGAHSARRASQTPPDIQETLPADKRPILLILPERKSAAPFRKDDLLYLTRETLYETIQRSNRYLASIFSPSNPAITRAVREHVLATADLIEPLKPETQQRIAKAMGATYLLTYGMTTNGNLLVVDTHLQQATGQQGWISAFREQFSLEMVYNRRRYKPEELANMAVDVIARRMNIPSLLDEKLKQGSHAAPPKTAQNKEKQKESKKEKTPAPPDKREFVPIQSNSSENAGAAAPEPKAPANETAPKPPIGAKNDPGRPGNAPEGYIPFTTDAAPGRAETPPPPNIAPPPSTRADNEALALRFRQTGDLASVITSLRRAINERPGDIGLRRQLIQAYIERQLPDRAYAEALRAIRLAPADAGLHRLCGDTLMAKGDIPAAMKMYQEATRLDPTDVSAQVALGDALLMDNRYAEALGVYEAATRADTRSPLPYRRLARAYAGRAASDLTQYAASLDAIQKARARAPANDADAYLDDYFPLLRLMDSRLRDLLDQAQNTYQAAVTGKLARKDLDRNVADMKERAAAAADYLDKLPPAVGQDVTHAYYQKAAALLLQDIFLLRDFLMKGDTSLEESVKSVQVDARRTLTTAAKRLEAARAAATAPKTQEPPGI